MVFVAGLIKNACKGRKKMIDTIIFDLDGTLLPMDQDYFLKGYFQRIIKKFPDFNPEIFMKAMQYGVKGMIENNGEVTNEERFWQLFYQIQPYNEVIEGRFVDLYTNEFQELINYTNPTPLAKQVIDILLSKGYDIICCTNPLFPPIATNSRIKWAGLEVENFKYITTFDNSNYCKPNLSYYEEVLKKVNKKATSCLMVGNDVQEDMIVKKMGMKTFLLKDHIINSQGLEIEVDYQGNFNELLEFVKKLPER